MRNLKIIFLIGFIVFGAIATRPARAADDSLGELLHRTSAQVSSYLERISEVSSSERVVQEKLGDNGKTIEKEESGFNYLILLSSASGEISLVESRLADNDKPAKKLQRPLLVSNGFATLFLVFHPFYAADSISRMPDKKPSTDGRWARFTSNTYRAHGHRRPWQSWAGVSSGPYGDGMDRR